jgi:hypothetical protein
MAVDRSDDEPRIDGMRAIAVVPLLAAASLGAVAPGGSDASPPRVAVGRDISVRVPRGWHVVHEVIDPNQGGRSGSPEAGVIASFAVRFGRHPCPCARPNYRTCGQWCEETSIRNFPSAGAIVFVWEVPAPRKAADLGGGFVARAARFRVAQHDPHFAESLARVLGRLRHRAGPACVAGPGSPPSWSSGFLDTGRAVELEVYLGPAAGPTIRRRLDGLLNSLQIAPTSST